MTLYILLHYFIAQLAIEVIAKVDVIVEIIAKIGVKVRGVVKFIVQSSVGWLRVY